MYYFIMPRLGREFELLVKRLEITLGSRGIQVQSPEYIKGKSKVTHEIDVSLRGQLQSGTIDFLIIVQCRERHKKGDAPWLMEIESKKEDVNAIRAIAVSSSGFTKEAVKYAKEKGIILRTLNQLNGQEIAGLYDHMKIRVNLPHARLNTFEIKFLTEYKDDFTVEIPCIDSIDGKDIINPNVPSFTRKSDGTMDTLSDMINSAKINIFDGATSDNYKKFSIHLDSTNLLYTYHMTTSQGLWDIDFIEVTGLAWIETINCLLKTAHRYTDSIDSNKIIMDTATFEMNGTAGKGTLHLNINPQDKKVSLQMHYKEVK
jgi:hypothetical protein